MTEWKEQKNDTCHLIQIVITRALNRSVSFNTSEYINLFDMFKVAISLFLLSLSASAAADNAPDVSALKLSRKYSLSQAPRHLPPGYPYPTKSNPQKEQYYVYSQGGDVSPFPGTKLRDFHLGSNSFGYSTVGQEYWNPSAWNSSHVRYHQGGYNREPVEGSHFAYKYQHIQHPQQGYQTYKKPFYYYGKSKFFKAPEKAKQKKHQYMYYGRPSGFKKAPYQRVYTPNTVHTYPVKKNGYQYYRRHYQTHFIPASDVVRSNAKNYHGYGEGLSTTSPPSTTNRISRDHSFTSEATNYNGTYSFGSGSNTDYYVEQSKAEPGPFPKSETGGYYGDRIYPSTKVSYQNAERGLGHRVYVAKSTPEEKEDGAGTVLHR